MRYSVAFLFVLVILASCHHNNKQVTEVDGSINPSEIASDTLNQLAIESSYEYSKTLPVSKNLVYDILAYGKPSEGQCMIIRRSANDKPDTLVKTSRQGRIEDVWFTHLNESHKGEIIIITRSVGDSSYYGKLLVYGVDNKDELTPVAYAADLGQMMNNNYMGRDSFYIQGNRLIRQFPLYATGDARCCPTGGRIRVPYNMKNASLEEGKMEMDIQ